MNRMPQISMIKIVMEYIGIYYLLVEILLHTLILLELNIFPKKYWTKSKISQLHTRHIVKSIRGHVSL